MTHRRSVGDRARCPAGRRPGTAKRPPARRADRPGADRGRDGRRARSFRKAPGVRLLRPALATAYSPAKRDLAAPQAAHAARVHAPSIEPLRRGDGFAAPTLHRPVGPPAAPSRRCPRRAGWRWASPSRRSSAARSRRPTRTRLGRGIHIGVSTSSAAPAGAGCAPGWPCCRRRPTCGCASACCA